MTEKKRLILQIRSQSQVPRQTRIIELLTARLPHRKPFPPEAGCKHE